MKVTSYKQTDHEEIVTIQDEYLVRVQIKKGKMVTLTVRIEDDSVQYWEGKTKADKIIVARLTPEQYDEISTLLEEIE